MIAELPLLAARPDPAELRWHPPQVEKRRRQTARMMSEWTKRWPQQKPYRDRFERELKPGRLGAEELWRDIRDHILPAFGRFLDEDKRDWAAARYRTSKIRHTSPTKMALTAADGLHGGLTNQAEQWFTMYVGQYHNESETLGGDSRDWILNAQDCVRDTLAISNFYTSLYPFELELLCVGTGFMLCSADPVTRARYYHYTFGAYWLAMNSRRYVDTAYLRHMVRAIDIVNDYGEENCPERVRRDVTQHGGFTEFPVIQCIQPWNYFGNKGPSEKWQYEDVHFVEGGTDDEKILYRGGFRTRPFVTATWADSGDSPYGISCPGFDALADIKELYECAKDYGMGIKWRVDPAFWYSGPEEYKHIKPGGLYRVADARQTPMQAIVPPDFDVASANTYMAGILERISATFYNREFLLVQSRERQITATEVNQLIVEKNTVLGPIAARISDNVLMPLLDRTFEIIDSEWSVFSVMDDPPEELDGLEIKPYFTGQLARAQRQGNALQEIMSTLQIAGGVQQLDQSAMAVFDLVGMIQSAEEIDLLSNGSVRAPDELAHVQEQQAQAMAQQQEQAQIANALAMAKTAGDTKVTPDTMAGRLAGEGGGEGMETSA